MTSKPSWSGLKSSGGQIPVKKFTGELESYVADPDTQFGQKISFHFTRVEVMATDAPWPQDRVDLSLKVSDSRNSVWGIWGESISRAMGISLEDLDPDMAVGKRWLVSREDEHLFFTRGDEQIRGTVWRAESADNMAAASGPQNPEERALFLLNGKQYQEFPQVAVVDDIIREDSNLVNGIVNKSWVESMEQQGKVTESGGVYSTA